MILCEIGVHLEFYNNLASFASEKKFVIKMFYNLNQKIPIIFNTHTFLTHLSKLHFTPTQLLQTFFQFPNTFHLSLAQPDCHVAYYDVYNLSSDDCGIVVSLTALGFQNWINANMYLSNLVISGAQLPDINFDITSFAFHFTDIQFANVVYPKIQLKLREADGGTQDAQWDGVYATFNLAFTFQQTVYPFLQDSGTGIIKLINADLNVQLHQIYSEACPQHIQIKYDNFLLKTEKIQIQLNSQMAFLYESLISIIQNLILNLFNNELTDSLGSVIFKTINIGLQQNDYMSSADRLNSVIRTDQRWLSIQVFDGYFNAYSPGNLCHYTVIDGLNHCVGSSDIEISKMNGMKTNDDIQYYISARSLQSQHNYIFNWNVSKYTLKQPCSIREFANLGIVVDCFTQQDNMTLLMKQVPFYTQDNNSVHRQLIFKIVIDEVLQCSGQCININDFIKQYEVAMWTTRLGYDNCDFVDVKNCKLIYMDGWTDMACNVEENSEKQ